MQSSTTQATNDCRLLLPPVIPAATDQDREETITGIRSYAAHPTEAGYFQIADSIDAWIKGECR